MSEKIVLTGKPSVDKPWMNFYPPEIAHIRVPDCTIKEYLVRNCPGLDVAAIHYYGVDIPWREVYAQSDAVAASLRAIGFGEGDQIPVFLRSVPEFVYLLLAAEKIGASLLCRDNTLEENVEAVAKSGARAIIAHDFLSQEELDAYLKHTDVQRVVLVDPCRSGDRSTLPEHIRGCMDANYPAVTASGDAVMSWNHFLALGKCYVGVVEARTDLDRPLFRAYTSGSTGPSKQVIHSARTMLSVVHQMNFYGASADFRPTWLVTCLPPALVAVVVSMVLLPLASNKLLILDPFCDPNDIDLELMRCRPNCWPAIPMFQAIVLNSKRIPEDFDMSFLFTTGAGCEAYNNVQLKSTQQYFTDHKSVARVTTGYGCSEAGSNITLPMTEGPLGNGNVGIPMPLNIMGIFKPGTQEELGYNEPGEICMSGPGVMLGYDDEESTRKALQVHADGQVWLHIGDTGYMDENGIVYTMTRGTSPRFGGGDLMVQPMENLVADAEIEGIVDEFFVVAADQEHEGYFLPYLYVVLEDGHTVDDIREKVDASLEAYMRPVEIFQVPERPFFHFKTNRLGLAKDLLSVGCRC